MKMVRSAHHTWAPAESRAADKTRATRRVAPTFLPLWGLVRRLGGTGKCRRPLAPPPNSLKGGGEGSLRGGRGTPYAKGPPVLTSKSLLKEALIDNL